MPAAFRFRAQAALDLRRRKHDEALRVMTHVQADLHAAERTHEAATAAAQSARASYALVLQTAAAGPQQSWYRSWIVRRDRERSAAARAVAARRADLDAARTAYLAARQQVEALERLRQKAYDTWVAAENAAEQKEFDALATMRYVNGQGDDSDYVSG